MSRCERERIRKTETSRSWIILASYTLHSLSFDTHTDPHNTENVCVMESVCVCVSYECVCVCVCEREGE